MRNLIFLALAGLGLSCGLRSVMAVGPENVAVLVVRGDAASLAAANHYRVKRLVPDQNFVYLDIPANRKETSWEDFSRAVFYPTVAMLERRGLGNQISVLLTTPGFPYRIGKNGLSGVCYFGSHEAPVAVLGPASFQSANGYFDCMESIVPPPPGRPRTYLHMHLDAGNPAATAELIDRSFLADNTQPKGTVYLLDGEGPRSTRKDSIPLAARMLECLGVRAVPSTTSSLRGRTDVLGMFSGVAKFPVAENRYVKGALGDLLTSVSGQLLDAHGQTRAWDWLVAGCSASYGTVVEPYNYPQKFPNAKLHVYYALGFTAVEAYWMSVIWPQEGLFVGDPLTRPFGDPPRLRTEGINAEQVFVDEVDFAAIAEAGVNKPGIAVVDMYIDDKQVGQFRRNQLPEPISLTLKVGAWKFEEKLPDNGNLMDVLARFQSKLAEKGVESIVQPGLMMILLPATAANATVEASSSHRYVHAKTSTVSPPRGSEKPASVAWLVQGNPELGDKLTFELSQLGKPTERFEFVVAVPMSSGELALRATAELAPKLPKGYQFTGDMVPLGGKRSGRMTLQAPIGQLPALPRVKLSLAKAPTSTLAVSPADVVQPLVDVSLNSYAVALVRFGMGEDRIRINARFPTTGMDEGRHLLRLVAKRGVPSLTDSRLVVPFVIRRTDSRLTLEPTAPVRGSILLPVNQKPVAVVRAKWTGVEKPSVDFFVDGQKTRVADKIDANTLNFDPKRYGIGRHCVTAVAKLSENQTLRSDNEVIVEVVN